MGGRYNKPTVLGKSPLLLACLCNALKSVLLLSSGRVAAILLVSSMGSSYLLGLAWHWLKSEPVNLKPAQLRWLQLHSGERGSNQPFSASLLFGRGLPSLSQLPVVGLAHHAGSHTCTAAWGTWDGSQVFLLAMGLSLVLLPSGKYHCYGVP